MGTGNEKKKKKLKTQSHIYANAKRMNETTKKHSICMWKPKQLNIFLISNKGNSSRSFSPFLKAS